MSRRLSLETIDSLLFAMKEAGHEMCTAATPFRPPADPNDPNLVKVVMTREHRAMYFSRSPIPFQRDAVGRTADLLFTCGNLRLSAGYPRSPGGLEADALRTWRRNWNSCARLEHDVPIGVILIDRATHGIDTPNNMPNLSLGYRNRT